MGGKTIGLVLIGAGIVLLIAVVGMLVVQAVAAGLGPGGLALGVEIGRAHV